MGYIIGFDGGGTKTRVILGDTNGKILADVIGEGSNHQSYETEHVFNVLNKLYKEVLTIANLNETQIDLVYLGLSGADLPSDFEKLNKICKRVFSNTKFKVVNDAWIIMRSGLKHSWGAVCICGTGTNAAAMNKNDNRAILRALGFTLGIYGGGLDIAREGLHYAFRADESTNKETVLQMKLPKLFGVNSMDDIVDLFYPKNVVDRKTFGQVTKIVFESANEGDEVCQDILVKVGDYLGKQTAGVIKQVKMEQEEVPVVIGGTVFSGVNPLLIDQFRTSLHRSVPKAYIIKPNFAPVYGAYLGGLDELGVAQTKELYDNLNKTVNIEVK